MLLHPLHLIHLKLTKEMEEMIKTIEPPTQILNYWTIFNLSSWKWFLIYLVAKKYLKDSLIIAIPGNKWNNAVFGIAKLSFLQQFVIKSDRAGQVKCHKKVPIWDKNQRLKSGQSLVLKGTLWRGKGIATHVNQHERRSIFHCVKYGKRRRAKSVYAR